MMITTMFNPHFTPALLSMVADVQVTNQWKSLHYFTGDIKISAVMKEWPRFLQRKLGNVFPTRYVWWTTSQGVAIVFAGAKEALRLLPEFFQIMIDRGFLGGFTEQYMGWAKLKTNKLIAQTLQAYMPVPNTRSYGGTRTQEIENA